MFGGSFTSLPFDEGEVVTLTAASIEADDGFQSGAAFYFIDGSRNKVSGTFAYPRPSGAVSETLVMPSGVVGLGWNEDVGRDSYFTQFNNLGLTCAIVTPVTPVSPIAFSSDLAKVSVLGQQRAVNGALRKNIDSRVGGGGNNVATRNSVFISTQNYAGDQTTDVNAWAALDTRAYFNGYEGYSADLTFGADFLVAADTLLGVMFGANTSDLKDSLGNDTTSKALLAGVYGGHRFAGTAIVIDGYLSYSAVAYDTGATTVDTDRFMAGMRVSGDYAVEYGTVTLRGSLSGAWEDFPAGAIAPVGGTTQQTLLSVGAKMAWDKPLQGTSLFPFASLDVEYGWYNEVTGANDEFIAPRVGLGLAGTVGGGQLALSVDAGRTSSTVIDVGLGLSYGFTF